MGECVASLVTQHSDSLADQLSRCFAYLFGLNLGSRHKAS